MKFSLISSIAALAGMAAAQVDLSQVYVENITYGGTGCPQGTVGIQLNKAKTTFTLILDEYVAFIGPGVAVTQSRKNCQISVSLHYPSGFQYSILSADYRGFVDLDKGVTATQKANYYFSGEVQQASTQAIFNGPISKDYLIHDEIPFTSTVWAPCGVVQALNINSQVRLDNGGKRDLIGQITTDSIDGKVTFVVGLQWQACPK